MNSDKSKEIYEQFIDGLKYSRCIREQGEKLVSAANLNAMNRELGCELDLAVDYQADQNKTPGTEVILMLLYQVSLLNNRINELELSNQTDEVDEPEITLEIAMFRLKHACQSLYEDTDHFGNTPRPIPSVDLIIDLENNINEVKQLIRVVKKGLEEQLMAV